MSDHAKRYPPSGPIDPVAGEIAGYFRADPVWLGLKTRPLAETRAAMRAAAPSAEARQMDRVEDFRVPVEGGAIGLRVYRSAAPSRAVIVWAHGGGFALGSVDETDSYARALAWNTGCAVASVDYRLAPEFRFPTAVEDVQAATLWIADHRREFFGGDVPLFLGGDSAGANLATVVTRRLHETGIGAISGNILAYPCTDNGDAASLLAFEPPFLNATDITWFFEQYLPGPQARNHPDFAPLHAPRLDLLPPSLIITAEHDVITEQAEEYGRKLAAADVEVRVSRHPGMIHGFLTMDVFFEGAAGTAMREMAQFIDDVVGRPGDAPP